jgi:hypothetical protein
MPGLFDFDDEPPPFIGLSGVLAVLAGGVTGALEAHLLIDLLRYPVWLFFAPLFLIIALMLPYGLTALFCIFAIVFHQERWAIVSAVLVIAGVVLPVVISAIVTWLTS